MLTAEKFIVGLLENTREMRCINQRHVPRILTLEVPKPKTLFSFPFCEKHYREDIKGTSKNRPKYFDDNFP